jgi:DNA-directed RNA polymerase subunit F
MADEETIPSQASGDIMTVPEVKHLLDKERKDRGELSYEQKLAFEHADAFTRLTVTKARKLYKELQKIERVSPAHAAKIVELAPAHPDEVEVVFAKDRFTMEKGDIEKILALVKESLE